MSTYYTITNHNEDVLFDYSINTEIGQELREFGFTYDEKKELTKEMKKNIILDKTRIAIQHLLRIFLILIKKTQEVDTEEIYYLRDTYETIGELKSILRLLDNNKLYVEIT